MDRKPLIPVSPNSQDAEESKVPSTSVSASQDPSPDSKQKRERSPLKIPATSLMELDAYYLPVPKYDPRRPVYRRRRFAGKTTVTKHKNETEVPMGDDKPPTCTKPDRKDSVDYFESLDDRIAASIKAVELSPSKDFWEATGAIPKYLKRDSIKTPPKILPPFRKQTPTPPKIRIELFPDGPGAVGKSEKLPETSQSSSVGKPDEKLEEPSETSPSSAVGKTDEISEEPSEISPSSPVAEPDEHKSEEPHKCASSSSTETESQSKSTESKSPSRGRPKSRSDCKDNMEWVRFNCLDFQDYKRTVNNKQKGVENSLDQVIPMMESSKKDVQNLAKKITQVRSEICDSEEALKLQNDKLKYLVGRTMATVSKIDKILERFRTDILAYTTLSTEGNVGIEFRLNRLLRALCGINDGGSALERDALIREAFAKEDTWTDSDSKT